MSFAIEKFYLFFEGIMLFQVAFFGMVYLQSKRKDVLLYALLNLVSGIYFFLNAPDTFLDIDENIIFNSRLYLYVNFAIFLSMILLYLLFLKEIFSDTVEQYPSVKRIYTITLYAIPVLYLLFLTITYMGGNANCVFYTGHLINGPFCTLLLILNFSAKGYKSFIIAGMMIIFVSIIITIILTLRYNAGNNETVLDKYPLAVIKLGMLIDIILFQLALLKRWQQQENELALQPYKTELAIEKIKNQISKELHDDIGSTLSGIQLYSHMAMTQASNGKIIETEQSLKTINQSSNDIVERLKDIVWFTNSKKIQPINLFERIKEYVIMIAQPKEIQPHFIFPEIANFAELATEINYNIYLICKEAVNNAVKYSGTKTLSVCFSTHNNTLTVEIKDEGCGFNTEDKKEGFGLSNMRKRAEEMGESLTISSKKNMGTSVKFEIPLQFISTGSKTY